MHDTVIRGGTIVDGTGQPSYTGDVALDERSSPKSVARPGRASAKSMRTVCW